MFEVSLQSDAEDELNAAAIFYELRQAGLGKTFLNEVASCLEVLSEFPFVGSVAFDDYRKYLLNHFPYGVFYRIDDQQVLVLAIAHSSRRPGYWRDRIS